MPSLDTLRSVCCVPARRRNLCGLLMLMVVDLIWVGSAGLTRYLFKVEAYDKPFFTVYFKTTLFTIYLVAFIFWRPWQRLCCPTKRKKESSQLTHQQDTKNVPKSNGKVERSDEEEERNEQAVCRRRKDDDCDMEITISTLQGDNTPSPLGSPDHCCTTLVGPSQYVELKCSEDGEVEKAANHSTVVTPCCRGRASCVRFSRRVEVKHAASPEPGSSSTGGDKEASPSKEVPILTVAHVSALALMFGILWFFANYLYALALERQNVATVNILSSLSGVFVLLLSAIPIPRLAVRDKFTLTKFVITGISVVGAVMVGVSDVHTDNTKKQTINYGALLALGGAALYAAYLVVLNKLLPHPDSLEIPMFFGFVGLFVAVLLAPLVVAWHFIGWEEFQLPPNPDVWTLLLVNGFIGTVLSELLWLWGCLLTSSLVGTLSLSLVSPLSITYSIIIGDIDLSSNSTSPLFFIGAILIVLAFVCVAMVEHFDQWDPIWTGIKRLAQLIKEHSDHHQYQQLLTEESQQLIRSNSTSDHFNPLHTPHPTYT